MGKFSSDDHYVYYCGQESLRRNGVALIVNERVWNAVLGYSLKNDRMILVHFQGKSIQYNSNPSLCPNHWCWRSWSWSDLWRPTGEGNGSPLQYSCLENPVDRGAWWAAVHGVTQSPTWVKRLSMHAWKPTRPFRTNTPKRCLFHYRGLEWVNLTQMTIISTTVGRNPLEEME